MAIDLVKFNFEGFKMKRIIMVGLLVTSTIFSAGFGDIDIDELEIVNDDYLDVTAENHASANTLGKNMVGAGQVVFNQGNSHSSISLEDEVTVENNGRFTGRARNDGTADNGGINMVGVGQLVVQQAQEIDSEVTIEDTEIRNEGEMIATAINDGDANGGANEVGAGQLVIQQ